MTALIPRGCDLPSAWTLFCANGAVCAPCKFVPETAAENWGEDGEEIRISGTTGETSPSQARARLVFGCMVSSWAAVTMGVIGRENTRDKSESYTRGESLR